jgi:hypothetical protein
MRALVRFLRSYGSVHVEVGTTVKAALYGGVYIQLWIQRPKGRWKGQYAYSVPWILFVQERSRCRCTGDWTRTSDPQIHNLVL